MSLVGIHTCFPSICIQTRMMFIFTSLDLFIFLSRTIHQLHFVFCDIGIFEDSSTPEKLQFSCKVNLNLDLSNCFLMVRFCLNMFDKNTT